MTKTTPKRIAIWIYIPLFFLSTHDLLACSRRPISKTKLDSKQRDCGRGVKKQREVWVGLSNKRDPTHASLVFSALPQLSEDYIDLWFTSFSRVSLSR